MSRCFYCQKPVFEEELSSVCCEACGQDRTDNRDKTIKLLEDVEMAISDKLPIPNEFGELRRRIRELLGEENVAQGGADDVEKNVNHEA